VGIDEKKRPKMAEGIPEEFTQKRKQRPEAFPTLLKIR
jgi:hypothetical protein